MREAGEGDERGSDNGGLEWKKKEVMIDEGSGSGEAGFVNYFTAMHNTT